MKIKIEGIVLIAKLIQRFDFELDSNQSMKNFSDLTLKPKDGTKCFLKIRS
jgi:hypothetical protein